MGIGLAKSGRDLRSGAYFGTITVVVWLLFFCVSNAGADKAAAELCLFYSLAAGLTTCILLREAGYFNSLRLRPRKSDLLLVLIAAPLGAFLQELLFTIFFSAEFNPRLDPMIWSPAVALLVFACDYFGSRSLLLNSGKRKIVLNLLPHQHARLLADFASLGLEQSFEFLSQNDLRKCLLSRREREIALIVISRDAVSTFDAEGILVRAHLAGIPVMDYRSVTAELTGRVRLTDADQWSYILEATRQTPLLRAFSDSKRLWNRWPRYCC